MEIAPDAVYTLRLTNREYNLVTRALGLAAGLDVAFKAEERTEVHELNVGLVRQQVSHLRQQLAQAEAKLSRADSERGR